MIEETVVDSDGSLRVRVGLADVDDLPAADAAAEVPELFEVDGDAISVWVWEAAEEIS